MSPYLQKLDLYGTAVANLLYAQQDVHVGLHAYIFEDSVFQFINTVIPLTNYEYMNALNVARQRLISVGPQYASYFVPLYWFP